MRGANIGLLILSVVAGAFGSAVAYHSGYEQGFLLGSQDKEDQYHKGRELGHYEFRVNEDNRRLQEYRGFEVYIQQLQDRVGDLQGRVKKLEHPK